MRCLPKYYRAGCLVLVAASLAAGLVAGQEDAARPAMEAPALFSPAQPFRFESSASPATSTPVLAGETEQGLARPEELLATWIAEAIPSQYEKKEDWGRTTRMTVGLDASGRGLKIRLKKKKKDVPHGVWKHYRVWIREAAGGPTVEVKNLRAVAPGRAAASIVVSAPLESWGRTRIYQHGVHLGTYTAEGRSRVHLHLDCELGVRLDTADGWPVLVVEPEVRSAKVDLRRFRLTRISNADGPVVKELGRAARHLIEDELKPKTLTQKLNRAIDKKKDRLRFSPQDLMASGWSELLE